MMRFIDSLTESGGQDSIGAIGRKLELGPSETNTLIDAVAPALLRSLQKQTASSDGVGSLTRALETGGHQRYLDDPNLVGTADAVVDGNKILGHLFGSKDVSRNVAANAANSTGIDASLIKKALPMLAGLAMATLSRKSDSGRSLGSALPGLLSGDSGDGFGVDDVLDLARKFF